MDLVKRLERELLADWQAIQIERDAAKKQAALKLYHSKHEVYRKAKAWHFELSPVV